MNKINESDKIIKSLKSVFEIATIGFDDFYKEASEKSEGDYSTAASSGDSSKAASSGDSSKAESRGENAACSALGYRAAVSGDIGNLLMASEYVKKDGKYIPVGGKADIVDGKKTQGGTLVHC